MADGRVSIINRYFKCEEDGDGAPIPGTEDVDIWIDVETLLSFRTDSGSGPTYEQRTWVMDQSSGGRVIRWQRIYKDENSDPDAYVQVPMIDGAIFDSGTGPSYRQLSIAFSSGPANEARTNAIIRVFHAEFDGNRRVVVDFDDYIDVEVLEEHIRDSDAGPDFQHETWAFDSGKIPAPNEDLGLNENEYLVMDTLGSDAEAVWPSYREVAPE